MKAKRMLPKSDDVGKWPTHIVNVDFGNNVHVAYCSCESFISRHDFRKDAWKAANDHVGRGWTDLQPYLTEEGDDEQTEFGEYAEQEAQD